MNNKVRIFIISVLLAVMLWLVNHLNQEFTVKVPFIVHYEGMPMPANADKQPDSIVNAEVSGKGFALLKYYFDQPQVITLTASDFINYKRGDSLKYELFSTQLQSIIGKILPVGVKLSKAPSDTLSFSFVSYPSRDVPIAVPLEIDFSEGCMLSGPVRIIPRTAKITAPASLLSQIDSLKTRPAKYSGVCDTIRATLTVGPLADNKATTTTSEVHVLIPVSKAKAVELVKPYEIGLGEKQYKGEVTINLLVPEGMAEVPVVLQNEVREGRIEFRVKTNEYIRVVSISPASIPIEP